MGRLLRVAGSVGFVLGLSNCNMVVSDEPWFEAADAAAAPKMRDGLWRNDDPECRFDDTKPAERWPSCAQASFVRGDERWSMTWEEADEGARSRRTFAGWEPGVGPNNSLLVTNGDHLIAQVDTAGLALEDDPLPEQVEVASSADVAPDEPSWRYMYIALRAVGHDGAGKVTATESWSVQCGPLEKVEPAQASGRGRRADDEEDVSAQSSVTRRPFPGLTVVESNCVADSAEAVRRAAVLSEGLEEKGRSRWVREGWR